MCCPYALLSYIYKIHSFVKGSKFVGVDGHRRVRGRGCENSDNFYFQNFAVIYFLIIIESVVVQSQAPDARADVAPRTISLSLAQRRNGERAFSWCTKRATIDVTLESGASAI